MLSLLFLSVLFASPTLGIAQDMNIGNAKRAFTAAHIPETINPPFDPKVLLHPQTDGAKPIMLQTGDHLPRNGMSDHYLLPSRVHKGVTTSAAAAAQSSLTLDPNVIATGFENNGQDVPTAGQVASLTSSNNFINFCLTVPNLPITNGKQIPTGSCNPAPMGSIPSIDNMPSAKFTVPANGDTIPANTAFTITMAVANFETGNSVNAEENFLAAPQQLNAQGQIIGHSHVVVQSLTALDQTTPLDPRVFAFFKGLNDPAVNGVLTADVPAGLPAGFYKVSSINTAANYQPVLVPVAQHGSLDDASYFTVSDSGAAATPPTVAKRAPGPARVAQPAQKRAAPGRGRRSFAQL